MLHHHLRRVSRTPKTLAYVDYVASGTDTITIPAAAAAGDLAILYDLARSIASAPTLVTPSGWTTLSALQRSPVSAVLSYKILAAGEPGSTITGMNGNIADVKTLVVLRATPALAGVTVTDINEQATTGNPNAQTIEALTSYPYVVYGVCGGRDALPAWASAWYSDTWWAAYQRVGYRIYNAAGASCSVDCNDSGTGTFLHSCALVVT